MAGDDHHDEDAPEPEPTADGSDADGSDADGSDADGGDADGSDETRARGKKKRRPLTRQQRLKRKVGRLPTAPGVYLMKGRQGTVFYVGKASNLRARVRSYFNASGDSRTFVALLDRILYDVEFVVTANEKEALLLENNLIKEHRPRYNVLLRDDKNYLALRLDLRQPYPRLELVRGVRHDGARYFGPYHSARNARRITRMLNKHFQLRVCTDRVMAARTRPCLQHQIERCLAPCTLPVDRALYAERVGDVALFLAGREEQLLGGLEQRMLAAAAREEFEEAARLRDLITGIKAQLQEQHVVEAVGMNQDVLGLHREGDRVELCLMTIRQGRMIGSQEIPLRNQEFPDAEMLSSFVALHYEGDAPLPDEILVPVELEDAEVVAEWLAEKRGRRVRLVLPQRGYRKRLLDMATRTAKASFEARATRAADTEDMLARMQKRLRLGRLPHRIEGYDISTLQGEQTVGSMVVMEDGEPAKKQYRHFKIRSAGGPDDYAALREMLSRRFTRAQAGEEDWEPPDLLVVDGGKGQLNTVLTVLADLGVPHGGGEMDVVSLAKERSQWAGAAAAEAIRAKLAARAARASAGSDAQDEGAPGGADEGAGAGDASGTDPRARIDDGAALALPDDDAPAAEDPPRAPAPTLAAAAKAAEAQPVVDRVFLPGVKDPIRLRPNTAELFLLARLRDEAHRFAITYHRKLRRAATLTTALLDIPGVGPKRAKTLLRHFGSVRGVQDADRDALAAAPGMSARVAETIWAHFHPDG